MIKHRDIITTPRVEELRRKRKNTQILYACIGVVVVIILCAGIVLLSRMSSLSITRVTIQGTRVLDQSIIEQYFWNEMGGSYIWLIPKNNSLVYPKRHILRTIQNEFPRIESIQISKNGLQELQITITERDGKYLWCGDVFPEPENTPCYFMDDTGYIFAEAPYFSGTVYFKWYGGDIDPVSPIGKNVFETEYISKLFAFANALHDVGVKPYAFVAKGDNVYELYLERVNDVGPKIILSTTDDLTVLLQNISSAFQAEPLKSLIEKGLPDISYFDLRYENKVYYK